MFGLNKKDVIVNAIKNVCNNEIGIYKSAVEKFAFDDTLTEDEINKKAMESRKEYLNAVFDAMWASFRASSPAIAERLKIALITPTICGLPEMFDVDYLDDNGVSAGCAFAMCYFAMTGKAIAVKDMRVCSMLNHFQNDLMNKALDDFEK